MYIRIYIYIYTHTYTSKIFCCLLIPMRCTPRLA